MLFPVTTQGCHTARLARLITLHGWRETRALTRPQLLALLSVLGHFAERSLLKSIKISMSDSLQLFLNRVDPSVDALG